MKVETVAFLVRGNEVCLVRMKRGRFAKKLSGYGGKAIIKTDDSNGRVLREDPIACTIREVAEETGGVQVRRLREVGVIYDAHDCGVPTRTVHIHAVLSWQGVPQETDETGPPEWYPIDDVPVHELPSPLDALWLPRILQPDTFVVVHKGTQKVEVHQRTSEQKQNRLRFSEQAAHV